MNRLYDLIKSAEEDEHAGKKALVAGAVAASTLPHVRGQLLGYHNVFHGSRDKSRKEGFKTSKPKGIFRKGKESYTYNKTSLGALAKTRAFLRNPKHEGVHSVTMPHSQYMKMKKTKSGMESSHGTPGSRIRGSKDFKGTRQFATPKNMKRYLGSSSGRLRAAKGLAGAAVGGASLAYGARKLKEKIDIEANKSRYR